MNLVGSRKVANLNASDMSFDIIIKSQISSSLCEEASPYDNWIACVGDLIKQQAKDSLAASERTR